MNDVTADSISARLRALFWIAATNFIFPGKFYVFAGHPIRLSTAVSPMQALSTR
jgi:hypothetical protein